MWSDLSMMRGSIPARFSSIAAVMPVGPAPTIRISFVIHTSSRLVGCGRWQTRILPEPFRSMPPSARCKVQYTKIEIAPISRQVSDIMTTKANLVSSIEGAATNAGLKLVSASEATDMNGRPTQIFKLGLPGLDDRNLQLELTESFDFSKPELLPEMAAHLAAEARRLRNPRPDCYVTLGGLPLSFGKFQWPFHRSTSGADTYIVHGEIALADGGTHNLHAKVAASVTVTVAEIVPAMEQPYAESFVYNAIRKTVDLGQLEFLKSGNRQPVPVTTRFYSRWQKKFVFTDTDDKARLEYLLSKVY